MLLEQLEELEHYLKPAEVVVSAVYQTHGSSCSITQCSGEETVSLQKQLDEATRVHLLEFQPCGCKCRLHLVVPAEAFLTCLEHFIYCTLCAERGVNS